jgi:hypothetical protein
MTFGLWRQEMKRQRQFSRRAASALDGGAGAFRIEACHDVASGRLIGVTKRWRFGEVALPPREVLGLDPRHYPAGTSLLIVPPGWEPPVRCWYTYEETAFMLRRAVPTIRNLVYKHKLEHKTYWDARGEHRRRVTDLPPATVRRLAELTGRGHWVVPTVERWPKSRPRPAGDEDVRRAVLERLRRAETLGALAGQPERLAGAEEPS